MAPFYSRRPLNFAHRGASHQAPENTLAAFCRAIELGADGIEFDVQLSKDAEVVVIHDSSVEATTDGQGPVRDKTLAELEQLDAGSWFDPAFAGERIPTLRKVFDVVGHQLLLNIELKTASLHDDGLAQAVVHAVKENQLEDRVIISSFKPLAIWRVKRLAPHIPVGLLYAPDSSLLLRRPWLRTFIRPEALHPYYQVVDGSYVRWANEQGYRVNVWTADEPEEMRQLISYGVDVIITNRPDRLRSILLQSTAGQETSGEQGATQPLAGRSAKR